MANKKVLSGMLALGIAGGGLFGATGLAGAESQGVGIQAIAAAQGQTTDDGVDAERPSPGAWMTDALAPLVEAGTITQDQADSVTSALEEARPERGGRGGPGGHFDPTVLTDTLDMTSDELREALKGGQTLVEVAEAQGVSVEDLTAAMTTAATERIQTAVDDGSITQEQADERLAELEEQITAQLNGEGGARGPGGRGGHGPRGGFGDGNAPADAPADAPAEVPSDN